MHSLGEEPVVLAAVVILALFLAGMVGLGIRAQRYNKSFDDKITAGHATTLLLFVGSALGAQMGNGFIMGQARNAAGMGLGGAWFGISCGIGYLLLCLLTRYYYRRGYVSMGDYLGDRYGERRVTVLYTLSMCLCCLSVVAAQLLAGQTILEAFGVPGGWSTGITIAVSFVFATLTGLWGAFAATALQSAVFAVSILAAFAVLVSQHGTGLLAAELPARYFSLFSGEPETIIGVIFPTITMMLTGQLNVQRIASAKTERTAFSGHILAGLIISVLAFVPTLLGMFARVLYPDAADTAAFPELLVHGMPVLIAGFLLAAILSAVIAQFCTISVLLHTVLIHDILKNVLRREVSEKGARLGIVLINIGICIVGVLLTRTSDNIIEIVALGYTFMGSGCLAAILGGMLWKRPGAASAWLSILAGILIPLLQLFGIVDVPYLAVTACLVSVTVYVAAAFLHRGEKA